MSRSRSKIRIGITPGEPAGIGPDICLAAHQIIESDAEPVFFADPELLRERAVQLGVDLPVVEFDSNYRPGAMNVSPAPLKNRVIPGSPDTANSTYVIETLSAALMQCQQGRLAGMVTGPVNKAVINESGTPFSGHTEWLAEQTSTPSVVMMLVSGDFRVALATTHLPLAAVPAAITTELLTEVVTILHHDLQTRFHLAEPRISVCGLNPHAGEEGHLGHEETRVIIPALESLREKGLNLTGPLPADTAFTGRALEDTDAVLALFHDQGLPVLKHAAFGDAINVTLGLPIIRVSVDHGTAFDLAGTGKADPSSLIAAVRCAVDMAGQ